MSGYNLRYAVKSSVARRKPVHFQPPTPIVVLLSWHYITQYTKPKPMNYFLLHLLFPTSLVLSTANWISKYSILDVFISYHKINSYIFCEMNRYVSNIWIPIIVLKKKWTKILRNFFNKEDFFWNGLSFRYISSF